MWYGRANFLWGNTMNNELSEYQKRRLLKNKYVEKITENHVVFTCEFKTLVVEAAFKGMLPDEFFKQEARTTNYLHPRYASTCHKRWKKKYIVVGKKALAQDSRGKSATGRPSTKGMTYEELEAIVKIQQMQIDAVKKYRAQQKKK